jgi:DNA-binding XRE family transcriptional regulator
MIETRHHAAFVARATITAASPFKLPDRRRRNNSLEHQKPRNAGGFNATFCARLRVARVAGGITQAEIAQALGVNLSSYQKYETRTPLPHRLVERFVVLTGADFAELFAPPPCDPSTVDGLIDGLGGNKRVAKLVGVGISAVSNWRNHRAIHRASISPSTPSEKNAGSSSTRRSSANAVQRRSDRRE